MTFGARSFPWLRRALFALDPERAHRLTIAALRSMPSRIAAPRLPIRICGLDFPNPLGLAAGFDKDGEVPGAILGLGFGFVEVGTVTPKPQAGNPRPRLFRLHEDEAIVNRMGFNSGGHVAALNNLARRPRGIVGINIGTNKDSSNRVADYIEGLKALAPHASYITVNISSPNTPGLRGLQNKNELQNLLTRLHAARQSLAARPPLVLKIAPDLEDDGLTDIADVCLGGLADAIIVSNTTVSRPTLVSSHASEAGGLSGAPLFALSTRRLARLFLITKGAIPLIGVGGVRDAETAWAKIEAGASLIQLYTALVYRGPGVIDEILDGIAKRLRDKGLASFADAIGGRAEHWAHHGLAGT